MKTEYKMIGTALINHSLGGATHHASTECRGDSTNAYLKQHAAAMDKCIVLPKQVWISAAWRVEGLVGLAET